LLTLGFVGLIPAVLGGAVGGIVEGAFGEVFSADA